jgi:hypothetical protein
MLPMINQTMFTATFVELHNFDHMCHSREARDFYIKPQPTSDWKQTAFVAGPQTPPSDAKRKKLRAKRKNNRK